MNNYQQPSFKFETNIAKYDCQFEDSLTGKERWVVNVVYNSSEPLTGSFIAPATWSRELLFGWLSRMELSEV